MPGTASLFGLACLSLRWPFCPLLAAREKGSCWHGPPDRCLPALPSPFLLELNHHLPRAAAAAAPVRGLHPRAHSRPPVAASAAARVPEACPARRSRRLAAFPRQLPPCPPPCSPSSRVLPRGSPVLVLARAPSGAAFCEHLTTSSGSIVVPWAPPGQSISLGASLSFD